MSGSSKDAPTQAELSAAALAMKQEAAEQSHHPATEDHANEGAVSTPRPDQAPSGALDAEGHRPVLERSRKVR